MRTLAIGDIHGCLTAFDTLLDAVKPRAGDRIVTLGDYVDRGPDTAGVLDRLVELSQSHDLVPLRGNHDELMLSAREDDDDFELWLDYGGDDVLESYDLPVCRSSLNKIPARHWAFLAEQCRDLFETSTHFYVHGGVRHDLPLNKQRPRVCRWTKFRDPPPHESGKTMVCGHTSQKTGRPRHLGHAVCIDTWVYGRGWLTCLEVETGKVWQANRHRETRTAHVDAFRVDAAVTSR